MAIIASKTLPDGSTLQIDQTGQTKYTLSLYPADGRPRITMNAYQGRDAAKAAMGSFIENLNARTNTKPEGAE